MLRNRTTPSLVRQLVISGMSALAVARDDGYELGSYRKGSRGDVRVTAALACLPASWQHFRNIHLNGRRLDHVVAGQHGVFLVSARRFPGRVYATGNGLYVQRRLRADLIGSLESDATALGAAIGTPVLPVLAIAGGHVEGDRAGDVAVVQFQDLVPHLLSYATPEALSWEETTEVFDAIGSLG